MCVIHDKWPNTLTSVRLVTKVYGHFYNFVDGVQNID